ncbi:MAG TPA: cytochrome c [Candidatus Binataceae bacterium]|nr:cytochrome c [Candidatus Binataceae bacterium]
MKRLLLATIILALAMPVIAGAPPPPSHQQYPPPIQLYMMNCWGCHQTGGEGTPGAVPRFKDTVGNFLRVPGGRGYLVEVPGVAGSALSNAQIAQVLNWLLVAFSKPQLPSGFKPYTETEVALYRPHELNDIRAVRADLVAKLAARGIALPRQ